MDEDVHDWMSAMHWICQNGLVRGAWMAVANGLACVWLSAPSSPIYTNPKMPDCGHTHTVKKYRLADIPH